MTLKLFPGIEPRHLTGGAQWYDYQMVQNDRLTYAFAEAADRAGAVLVNYVEGVGAIREGARIMGIEARDVETGRPLSIRARLTVNAAGAGAGRVRRWFGIERPYPLLATMNLVARRPPKEVALAAPTADGRMLTLVPWLGRVVVGTSHSTVILTDADLRATGTEIDRFISQANEAFPALALTRQDVTLVHRGLVPAFAGRNGHVHMQSTPSVEDHGAEGAPGAMTVIGVKYTTARGVAERAINRAARILGQPVRRSATASTLLPGAGIGDHAGLVIETAKRLGVALTPPIINRLSEVYADTAAMIITLMAEEPDLRETLAPESSAVAAEIAYVIRHESAIHLTDVVLRRTGLGAAGHPGADVLSRAAAVAARELGWDETKRSQEIAAVDAAYRVP
jgi:glycerol-3-phosphate dehydrogenase